LCEIEDGCFERLIIKNYRILKSILVSPEEIDDVMVLVNGAIEKMEREGIHQWDEI